MITGELRSKVDKIWDAFWSGGLSNPLKVAEQITYLLFLRRLDDPHTKGFLINVPPLPLQQAFFRSITAVEKLRSAQRASLAELDALFASLQHRAFRGEL